MFSTLDVVEIVINLEDVDPQQEDAKVEVTKHNDSDQTGWYKSYETVYKAIAQCINKNSWHKHYSFYGEISTHQIPIDKLDPFIKVCTHGFKNSQPAKFYLRVTLTLNVLAVLILCLIYIIVCLLYVLCIFFVRM